MLGVAVVQGPEQAVRHVQADRRWENEKIIQELTAFLPVENVPDHGDVAALKVDVHLGTSVLAFRNNAHYGPCS